jgi:hypothetical protein
MSHPVMECPRRPWAEAGVYGWPCSECVSLTFADSDSQRDVLRAKLDVALDTITRLSERAERAEADLRVRPLMSEDLEVLEAAHRALEAEFGCCIRPLSKALDDAVQPAPELCELAQLIARLHAERKIGGRS